METSVTGMTQLQLQQIECLIVLAEELHFGKTGRRLGYTQSRASQLIGSLEQRVGVRLVDRTSRRVQLTRFGKQFVEEVQPAYEALSRAFEQARDRAIRGQLVQLRIGFHAGIYEDMALAFKLLRTRHHVDVQLHEIPLGAPYEALISGELDAALVELPAPQPEIAVGHRFPAEDRFLAVGMDHPYSSRVELWVDDLAKVDLVRPSGHPALEWTRTQVPTSTTSGAPIRSTATAATLQEGLGIVAGGTHAMLLCRPTAARTQRSDIIYLPVRGLEKSSQLALVWGQSACSQQLELLSGIFREIHESKVPAPSNRVTTNGHHLSTL